MTQVITVLTTQRPTRRQIARALSSGGMSVEFQERAEGLIQQLERPDTAVAIIDIDGVETAQIEVSLAALATGRRRLPVILVSLAQDKQPLLELIRRHDISNLVAKHGAIRAVYPVLDERELLVTCQKVLRRDIFGLEKYVGSWGVVIHRRVLTTLAEKRPLMKELEHFLAGLDCPSSVVPDILTAAEELILNAVVHAPRDADGQPKYEHVGPDPRLKLQPHEYVDLAYACDGQRLMVSVGDRFGTLNKQSVHDYVARLYGGAKLEVEQKPSGAGIGLSMAFQGIHQLVFNVQESVRTEAIAGWYLRINTATEFRQVSKSLNLFWLPADSTPVGFYDSYGAAPPPPPPREEVATKLTGRIDEASELMHLARARSVDLRGVTGFSSHGVVKWLKLVNSLGGRELTLVNCPESLVRLASEVTGMLKGIRVESLLVPFECRACSDESLVELPPDRLFDGPARSCLRCGGALAFSGCEVEYRAFLEQLEAR